jgi:hypothetical protein
MASLGVTTVAQADTFYSYFYVAGQANYSAAPNSDVQVPLYLQEVSNDNTSLLADESGLWAAGVSVSTTGAPSSPALIAALLGNSGAVPNGFDGIVGPVNVSSASASLLENNNLMDTEGVLAGPQQNGVSEVFLGTLTVHTGAIAGQTTTFTVGPYDVNSGNTFTNNNLYDLDDNLDPGNPLGADSLYASAAATTFSVSTAAVPEPGMIELLAVGAVILIPGWSIRRKRLG